MQSRMYVIITICSLASHLPWFVQAQQLEQLTREIATLPAMVAEAQAALNAARNNADAEMHAAEQKVAFPESSNLACMHVGAPASDSRACSCSPTLDLVSSEHSPPRTRLLPLWRGHLFLAPVFLYIELPYTVL